MAVQNENREGWIDAEDPEPVLEPDLPIIKPHITICGISENLTSLAFVRKSTFVKKFQ